MFLFGGAGGGEGSPAAALFAAGEGGFAEEGYVVPWGGVGG